MWIRRGASYHGERTAVVFGGQRLTFREVHERSNRLANGLLDLGIKKGDRVASLNRNCSQHIEIAFARYKIGSVDVTLNPRLSLDELIWQLNDSESEVLFVSEELLGNVRQALQSRKTTIKHVIPLSGAMGGEIDYEALLSSSSHKEPPPIEVDEKEPGAIMYSGGTTGRPKGIVHPRQTIWAVTRNMLMDMIPDLTKEDVFLGLQPLYHAVGMFILPCWLRGATHVIVPEFKPEIAFDVIEEEKVTAIKTVPTVLIRMLDNPDLNKKDLNSLKTIIYGASPMPVEKLKQAIRIFGPIFIQNYGQTEAPLSLCLLRKEEHVENGLPEGSARLASIGRPYTSVEVRVVGEDGRDVSEGEIGELTVRGDHMMKEYWKLPEETEKVLKNGWLKTRDMAKMDKDGYVFLVDRKSEMIISGGLNIYPNEVEQVLYRHPAVREAAVFGIPDEAWGEMVKAVVSLRPGASVTEVELIDFCRSRLAGFKKPKSIDFVENLPKSAEGKVLRRELRAPYWKGFERAIN